MNKIDYNSSSKSLKEDGITKLSNVVKTSLCKKLLKATNKSFLNLKKYEIDKTDQNNNCVAHHVLSQDESYLDLLEIIVETVTKLKFFDNNFILDTFTIASASSKNDNLYTRKWHIDSRRIPNWLLQSDRGKFLMINVLVPITDFRSANGSTQYITKSHLESYNSQGQSYDENDIRTMEGKEGDIFIFNSNLVHRAGINKSGSPRVCIAIMFVVPWLKQQFDYASEFIEDKLSLSRVKKFEQVIGFGSQIPKSLSEWYQPFEKRKNRGYK